MHHQGYASSIGSGLMSTPSTTLQFTPQIYRSQVPSSSPYLQSSSSSLLNHNINNHTIGSDSSATTFDSSSNTNKSKEAFDNFNNVDPQATKAYDHANAIIDSANSDKTFSVFAIPPREALAFYLGVEEHYQKEQTKPVCPLCLRQLPFSSLSKHVISCAEYRNSLLNMEESPPIKSSTLFPVSSSSSLLGPTPTLPLGGYQHAGLNAAVGLGGGYSGMMDGPLLGKRKKLDSELIVGGLPVMPTMHNNF